MDFIISVLKVLSVLSFSFILGKLFTKIKLPAILGWLISGMILGPCLANIITEEITKSNIYIIVIKILEGFAGVMIGSEIIFSDLKKYGVKTIIITLFQSLGTFILVSLAFICVFSMMDIPIFLAFVMGGIALATAPAPALSIVREYKTQGPVTRTLIPLAIIDDIIGIIVFFTVISFVAGGSNVEGLDVWKIIISIIIPIISGSLFGLIVGFICNKIKNCHLNFIIFMVGLILPIVINIIFDLFVIHSFMMNYILLGVFYSCICCNILKHNLKHEILKKYSPILSISLLVVIVNLGLPLDYKLIASSGLFTIVYILFRAIGKLSFSSLGSIVTKSEKTITKWLGFTLLPHSGVSLIFTGIAASILSYIDPNLSIIVTGTIASAAVINEIIAVILAKFAFVKAKEINNNDIIDNYGS